MVYRFEYLSGLLVKEQSWNRFRKAGPLATVVVVIGFNSVSDGNQNAGSLGYRHSPAEQPSSSGCGTLLLDETDQPLIILFAVSRL
jgi:hypothetical protein